MVKMKSKIILTLLLIGIIALSGCTDISDSYKPGSFGTTEEEMKIVDAVTKKHGDMTTKGEPRLLEVMMTSSTQNFVPVDKVLKYSNDAEKLYAWFIYDNFENDIISVEWIYLDTYYSIHTFESETGEDFGRGTFILEKPEDGWPLGNYKVIISGAGVEESVEFEIIDGETVSIPLEVLAGTTIDSPDAGVENTETTAENLPTPQSGFEAESTSESFIGEWTTNWGDMTITQSGDKIIGEYTHDKGKIEGIVNGDVFIGTWSESPSYAPPNDAGDVELKLSSDGNSFEGNWRYGSDDSSWSGGWTGTRVAQSTTSSSASSSGVEPGWYLVEVVDYNEVGEAWNDYYTYGLDYKRGDVTTSDSGEDGEIARIRTISEEPNDFYAAEEEIAIKVRKEGVLIETDGLGMGDTSSITIDDSDIEPGSGTSSAYDLKDETYGEYLEVGWPDSTGTVKEGTFKETVPGAGGFGDSFAVIYTYYNGDIYGTKYIYEWRE
jgi:hypothetical protein